MSCEAVLEPATRAEICIAACARAWQDDGEILASPIGRVPRLGALLAQRLLNPELLLSDGGSLLLVPGDDGEPVIEGWLPFRRIFDHVWGGRRHAMMGAAQIDRFGSTNISYIGSADRPTAQLIGMRGAPGNTLNHPCSFWIPNHSSRVFVERVDVVSGVGNDPELWSEGVSSRFHDLRLVITNLAVLDFRGSSGSLRVRSLHRGVELDDVLTRMSFRPEVAPDLHETPSPGDQELRLIRDILDPQGNRDMELDIG